MEFLLEVFQSASHNEKLGIEALKSLKLLAETGLPVNADSLIKVALTSFDKGDNPETRFFIESFIKEMPVLQRDHF